MCITCRSLRCASSNDLEHLLSAFLFYFCTRLCFALLCLSSFCSLAFDCRLTLHLLLSTGASALLCVCVMPPPPPPPLLPSGRSRRDRPQKAGWAKINRNKKNNLTNTTPGLRTHASSTCWEIRFFFFLINRKKKIENKSCLFQIDMKLIFVLFNWNQIETFCLSRNIWILFVYS